MESNQGGDDEITPSVKGSFTLATWNTNWATLRAERGPRIAEKLEALDADVIVVTEGSRELLPESGHVVDAGADWGYRNVPTGRRKVLVWSRHPLSLHAVGERGGTLGRLAVATTQTPMGLLRIIGVCIPWKDAHVNTGRRDAVPWSEHLDHLDQLDALLTDLDDTVATVIAGDFNQRIPRGRQPIRVAQRLTEVLEHWSVHTTGGVEHGPLIDHVVTSSDLKCVAVDVWLGTDGGGKLTDHSGVNCRLLRP